MTYALVRRGFDVEVIDDAGVDLVAERNGQQYAISVDARLFREGSVESKMLVIREEILEQLCERASGTARVPLCAIVVSMADEMKIHLFLSPVAHIRATFKHVQHGYSLYFSDAKIAMHTDDPAVAYMCWRESDFDRFEFLNTNGA